MSDKSASPPPPRRRSLRPAAGRARRAFSDPWNPPLPRVHFPPPSPASTHPSSSASSSPPRRPSPSMVARPNRRAAAPAAPAGRSTGQSSRPAASGTVGERAEVGAPARVGAPSVYPVDACGVVLPCAIGDTPGLRHLRRAHVIADVPAVTVADLGLARCAWCDAPFPTARPRTGRSLLVAHEAVCRANPRWNLRLAAARTPAGGRPGSPSPGSAGDADASAQAETPNMFGSDRAAWERAPRGFLEAVPATADG